MHTYLWEKGLHDGACKLGVTTENIIETLKQATVWVLSIKHVDQHTTWYKYKYEMWLHRLISKDYRTTN